MENKETNSEEKVHIADISCDVIFKVIPTRYLHVIGLFMGKVQIASYCMDGINSNNRALSKDFLSSAVEQQYLHKH